MPLLRFDVIEGRDKETLRKLLDVTHDVVIDAFQVPVRDRYQIVHQHPAHELVIEDTGLGFERSNDLVIISITSKTRTEEQKQYFYQRLVDELEAQCGIRPTDVMISITENGNADWSFGLGEAQFLTGKL